MSLAHKVLRVSEGASQAEVKAAFRELSLKHHPDKNNNSEGATKIFILIRAAYEEIMAHFGDEGKTDNFSFNSQNSNFETGETPFWKSYFASEEFKKFKAELIAERLNEGFVPFKVEVYNLLAPGEFSTIKEQTIYAAVRDCKSLEEIGFKGLKTIAEEFLQERSNEYYSVKLKEALEALEPKINQILAQYATTLDKLREEVKHMNYEDSERIVLIDYNEFLYEDRLFKKILDNISSQDANNLYTEFRDLGVVQDREKVEELLSSLREMSYSRFNKNFSLDGDGLSAALKGAVASQDLDKFFGVAEYLRSEREVIRDVLFEADFIQVDEERLLTIIKYLVEERKFSTDNYAVKAAVNAGFYNVAQYLSDHGSAIKDLSEWDLHDHKGHKPFEAFKWFIDHEAKVEKSLIGRVLCNDKLLPYRRDRAFDDADKVNDIIDFLIEEGVTTREKVTVIKENCDIVAQAIQSRAAIAECIRGGRQLNEIKLLIENGATLSEDSKDIVVSLLSHSNTEIVQYIIEEMATQNIKIYYPEGIVSDMAISISMGNCVSNKMIADYVGITGQIDWTSCEQHNEL